MPGEQIARIVDERQRRQGGNVHVLLDQPTLDWATALIEFHAPEPHLGPATHDTLLHVSLADGTYFETPYVTLSSVVVFSDHPSPSLCGLVLGNMVAHAVGYVDGQVGAGNPRLYWREYPKVEIVLAMNPGQWVVRASCRIAMGPPQAAHG